MYWYLPGIDVECIGSSRVFVVVNHRGDERCQQLDVRQPHRQAALTYDVMRRLCDVSSVHEVVIGVVVLAVALLQFEEERLQRLSVNLSREQS